MRIKNNQIIFNQGAISIGSLFEQAESIVKDDIYLKRDPDANGRGYMIVDDVNFYGLKGPCTLYFQNSKLQHIGINIDWSRYPEFYENGKLIYHIDEAVDKVASASENALENIFGFPVEKSHYGNCVFKNGNITISTFRSPYDDNYSISIE